MWKSFVVGEVWGDNGQLPADWWMTFTDRGLTQRAGASLTPFRLTQIHGNHCLLPKAFRFLFLQARTHTYTHLNQCADVCVQSGCIYIYTHAHYPSLNSAWLLYFSRNVTHTHTHAHADIHIYWLLITGTYSQQTVKVWLHAEPGQNLSIKTQLVHTWPWICVCVCVCVQ